MTDRPIIFSAPMVKALLDGHKTQTRRLLKPQPFVMNGSKPMNNGRGAYAINEGWQKCPYAPGDRLWVREAHSLHVAFGQDRDDGMRWGPWPGLTSAISPDASQIAYYREGFDRCGPPRWRPSIHMPRWASRLTLIVTDVRVERLQDISEADVLAEGVWRLVGSEGPNHFSREIVCKWSGSFNAPTAKEVFADLWGELHGPTAWDANPWVCAISFTVQRGNIDGVAA